MPNNFCPYNLTIVVLPRKKGEKATIFTIPQTDYFLFFSEYAAVEFGLFFLSWILESPIYADIIELPCKTTKEQANDQQPFYKIVRTTREKLGQGRKARLYVTLAAVEPIIKDLPDAEFCAIDKKTYSYICDLIDMSARARLLAMSKSENKDNEPPELTE